jgi:hypothetical protein
VLGDEVVMLDVDKGSYHLVDAIGTFVWQQLERPTAVASLIDTLQDRYDVTPERCEDDVLTYLEDLLAKGLIRHSERGA